MYLDEQILKLPGCKGRSKGRRVVRAGQRHAAARDRYHRDGWL